MPRLQAELLRPPRLVVAEECLGRELRNEDIHVVSELLALEQEGALIEELQRASRHGENSVFCGARPWLPVGAPLELELDRRTRGALHCT